MPDRALGTCRELWEAGSKLVTKKVTVIVLGAKDGARSKTKTKSLSLKLPLQSLIPKFVHITPVPHRQLIA